jgi:ubiquinone/menaquinone biosynthesis C-methylase UbiE
MSISNELQRLRSFATGFMGARVLITANTLGMFELLERPLSAQSVSKRLNLTRRATEILLDVLVSLGFLKKSGQKYQNSSLSKRFLIKKSPYYQGDLLRHYDNLWRSWSVLDEVVRTGEPSSAEFDFRAFIMAMDNIARFKVKDVIRRIRLKSVKRVLDLGGGPGTYSLAFARKAEEVVLYDRPETLRIAEENIKDDPFKNRIVLKAGDFMVDDLGRGYDIVFMSQILHSYSEKECLRLIKKVKRSLVQGGTVVIHEFYLDRTRTSPASGALFAVNMLVNTPSGRSYTQEELQSWLKKAGFRVFQSDRLQETVLIQAEKRGL